NESSRMGRRPTVDLSGSSPRHATTLAEAADWSMWDPRTPSLARRRRFGFALAIVAIAGSCRLSTDPTPLGHFGSGPRRILFIGNSLTGANEMPGMLVALAESARVTPSPSVDVDWEPDFALIDHSSRGTVKTLIANGHYDVVVMQQG